MNTTKIISASALVVIRGVDRTPTGRNGVDFDYDVIKGTSKNSNFFVMLRTVKCSFTFM
ncbi:MAG: hypothetical protein LBV41_02300 [Cytophagaceae bacterium]|jgi:hypothetical protein|nr:hypothetical protein [Cytophagaceae bacterium]